MIVWRGLYPLKNECSPFSEVHVAHVLWVLDSIDFHQEEFQTSSLPLSLL